MEFRVKAAAVTHVGKVRLNNEDNYSLQGQIREDVGQNEAHCHTSAQGHRFLAAVADGMGGEALGELASLLAVKALRPCSFSQIQKNALDSIQLANEQICAAIESHGGSRMGSTLAALYIDDGKALSCNIGDSRCYLLRDGVLSQLSVDHNKARNMVELGVLTPEQAAKHPSRHQLTQHLGIFEAEMILQPAFSQVISLRERDRFLLCSDGLTDMVPDGQIAAVLCQDSPVEKQTASLLQMALEQGGKDNVTALVVQIEAGKPSFLRKIFHSQ